MNPSRWIAICALALTAMASLDVQAEPICAMTKPQADKSPLCLRWYFACRRTEAKPSPGAVLDPATRNRLMLSIVLREAQASCEIFSYQEAFAAMQALLLLDSGPPANR
jgi:hypothetical protein